MPVCDGARDFAADEQAIAAETRPSRKGASTGDLIMANTLLELGDTVRMQTLSTCGPPEKLIAHGVQPADIPPYTQAIYDEVKDQGPGGHILTGPVAIQEAEPGDVLEVDILAVDIDAGFACNGFGLGRGFLPMEYPYSRTKIIPLDRKRMVGQFAPGIEIPLHPFFGSMGVAPAGGKIDSAPDMHYTL
jgi:acetamidase/formamidase